VVAVSEARQPHASLSALAALGSAYRGDWSEVDGRTIRAQLDEIADLVRAEVRGEDMRARLAGFYAANHICPRCQSWTDHCHCERAA
jgi:hypothetical protein